MLSTPYKTISLHCYVTVLALHIHVHTWTMFGVIGGKAIDDMNQMYTLTEQTRSKCSPCPRFEYTVCLCELLHSNILTLIATTIAQMQ